jgi:hypothetical protein
MSDNHESGGTDVVEQAAKRLSTSLTAAGVRLTIMAMRKADDTATVFVTTTDIKTKKSQRGMTTKFESFDAACERVKALAADAMKKGWQRAERSGGFKARPDAFTTLPTPPSSTKGKK